MELDQGEIGSPELQRHLEACPPCGREAVRLSVLYGALSDEEGPLFAAGSSDTASLAEAVLTEIKNRENRQPLPADQEVSLSNWILSGLVILGGFALVPFSSFFPLLRGLSGGTLEIAIPLSLGITITVYASLFIGTHVSTFRRLLHLESAGFPD